MKSKFLSMLEFNFNNPIGFLIAFLPALINLGIVGYILLKLPENRLTNLFALFTFALACWQINDSIARIANTAKAFENWDTIFCAAWIFVGPLCLHFALVYSSLLKKSLSRPAILLLYVPGIVFMLLYQAHIYPHFYSHDKFWGWINYHDKHWLDVTMIYWISVLVILATVIIFHHAYVISKDLLLKKQTIVIATGIAIPTITGVVGQVIMPIILNQPPIPFASTFMTFFSVATVISLNKYRLFNASDIVNNETLIDDMPIMMFSISERKRLSYINKYAAAALKINKEELGFLPLEEFLRFGTKEAEAIFYEAYQQALLGSTITNIESSFISDTDKIDVAISCKPIINNGVVQGVLFAARDITALKNSNELIMSKEMLLADAQQISHLGSWEWNIKTDKFLWSDELFRIYGFDPGESEVTIKQFIDWLHPDDQKFVQDIINNSFNTLEPFNYYARVIRKDKTQVIIHARGKVITDGNNNVVKMNGTAQDVTEQHENEKMLQRQNEELKKINNELDKFVYSVSHDLRAPLSSILGVIGIAQDDTTDEIILQHLTMLKGNVKKLDGFISDILDYSRNSRMEVKREEINFNELLSGISQNLKFMGGNNRKVEINIDVSGKPTVHTDKNRLSIVLNNLISNAIRYQNSQNPNPFVDIKVDTSDTETGIIIRDNGIGIRKELHHKIFDMFYRVSEESVGSGLGLYIVKESVNKLNGNIEVISEPGEGSTFTIKLPNN